MKILKNEIDFNFIANLTYTNYMNIKKKENKDYGRFTRDKTTIKRKSNNNESK